MDLNTLVIIAGFILQAGGLIVLATRALGKMELQTGMLSSSIDTLSKSVDRLEKVLEALDHKVDVHGERIAGIEARCDAMQSRE